MSYSSGNLKEYLEYEMFIILSRHDGKQEYRKLAWRASNGLLPTKHYNLNVEKWKPVDTPAVTTSGYTFLRNWMGF